MRLSAFGLIETCLTLMIMGLILSVSIRGAQTKAQNMKVLAQQSIAADIKKQLIAFHYVHKKLPYPMSSPSKNGLAPSAPSSAGPTLRGHLPVKTIGLLQGNRLHAYHYFVATSATTTAAPPSLLTSSSGLGGVVLPPTVPASTLQLIDRSTGMSVIDTRFQKIAAVVIPDHMPFETSADGFTIEVASHHLHNIVVVLEQDLIRR